MERRTALQRLAVLLGGIALSPELLAGMAARAAAGEQPAGLQAGQLELLAELAETILPETDTPGAKAAGVDRFIALMVQECLPAAEARYFWDGLATADAYCNQLFGKSFTACPPEARNTFLRRLEAASKDKPDPEFWRMLKSLTLQGYFSSEIGMTQALNYDPVPGVWIADMKADENTKAWANMI